VNCILRWAAHRERPTCPQCKQPFEHLFTYRRLDGGLHDFPVEESVTLLKRAVWFTNYMLVRALCVPLRTHELVVPPAGTRGLPALCVAVRALCWWRRIAAMDSVWSMHACRQSIS